jgi:hypothetical protein
MMFETETLQMVNADPPAIAIFFRVPSRNEKKPIHWLSAGNRPALHLIHRPHVDLLIRHIRDACTVRRQRDRRRSRQHLIFRQYERERDDGGSRWYAKPPRHRARNQSTHDCRGDADGRDAPPASRVIHHGSFLANRRVERAFERQAHALHIADALLRIFLQTGM